jgi:hypothetical protein
MDAVLDRLKGEAAQGRKRETVEEPGKEDGEDL